MKLTFRTRKETIPAKTETHDYVFLDGHKFGLWSFSDFLDQVGDIIVDDDDFGKLMLKLGILKTLGNRRWLYGASKGPNFDKVKKAVAVQLSRVSARDRKETQRNCKQHIWKHSWDFDHKTGKRVYTDKDYCVKCHLERKHVPCPGHRWKVLKRKYGHIPNAEGNFVTDQQCYRCGRMRTKLRDARTGKIIILDD